MQCERCGVQILSEHRRRNKTRFCSWSCFVKSGRFGKRSPDPSETEIADRSSEIREEWSSETANERLRIDWRPQQWRLMVTPFCKSVQEPVDREDE